MLELRPNLFLGEDFRLDVNVTKETLQ
jgi:hypothetical protein